MLDMNTQQQRISELQGWINEYVDTLETGLTPMDDDGNDMTGASARTCVAMWKEEIERLGGQVDRGPEPMEGEVESDFPTIFAR